ncbi:uncharacterized protein E0L32_000409 [Thyridium curvatum]|uniref:Clr5 domain-containing protein n=1 Tax=Thyridium curvatum TaxID=1093900 RepID=A0A507AT75_9PEZI|nr:uncharacterized protein E0L32_000409 [Thyridium curvatum]TPX14015.1 hypothetical protein E0L32_000409 [Thyridium curvatum]
MSHSTISQRKTTPREEGNKLDELAEEILELYKAETLGEVMKKINDKYKLHASKSQYRKRLEKWRVKKNVRRSDLSAWKRAGQELRETKHVDHESAVMYDGRIYSMQQVQGVLRRHDTPRLADKFNLSQQSLAQTLMVYREKCIEDASPRGLAETLLLAMPQPDLGGLIKDKKSLRMVSFPTRQDLLSLLHVMVFAIANHIEATEPSSDILCDLFHQVKHEKSWLELLFNSKDPVARCLSRAIFTSAFEKGDMAAIERCLQAGADTSRAVWSVISYWPIKTSMLVASLERKNLQLAKCLHRHAAPWTVPFCSQQKPIMYLLSTRGGRWLVKDDVWEFITQSYPQYRSEAYEFIQSKPTHLYNNWMVIQKLLPLFPGLTYSKYWQSAILFSALLAENTTDFPTIDNTTTLKDYEECLKGSALLLAIEQDEEYWRSTEKEDHWNLEDQILHVIRNMLSRGATLDTVYGYRSPMRWAMERKQWKIVEFLLDYGGSTTHRQALDYIRSKRPGKSKIPLSLLQKICQPEGVTVKDAIRHDLDPSHVRQMLCHDDGYRRSCAQAHGSGSLLSWIIQEERYIYLEAILQHDPMAYDCQALRVAVTVYVSKPYSFRFNGGAHFIENLLRRRQTSAEPCANEGTAMVFAICGRSEQLISLLSDAGIQLSPTLRTHSLPSGFPKRARFRRAAFLLTSKLGGDCSMVESQGAFEFLVAFALPKVVRSMLDQGFEVTERHTMVAVEYGRGDILEILLQNGGSICESHLGKACSRKDLPMIMKLLDLGVKVESKMWEVPIHRTGDHYQRTTFQVVVENGSIDMIEALIEQGADVNEPAGEWRGGTALQLAAGRGRIALARRLIELGADCNAPAGRTHGRTALEAAAEHGRLTMVQFLLHLGVSTTDEERRQYIRAIKFAAAEGHTVIEMILRAHRPWMDEDWQLWDCLLDDGKRDREEGITTESEESISKAPHPNTQELGHQAVDQSQQSTPKDTMAWVCGLESNDVGKLGGTIFGSQFVSSPMPFFGSPPLNMLLGQNPGHDTFASDLVFGADLSFSVNGDVMAGQGVQDASHSRLVLPFSETVASGSGDISKRHCEGCGNHLEQCYCVDFSFLDEMEIFDDDLLPLSED